MSYYSNPEDRFRPDRRTPYRPIGNGLQYIPQGDALRAQGEPPDPASAIPTPAPATGEAGSRPAPGAPRSDWLLFTDRLSDLAKEFGIIIKGEFEIVRELDSDKVTTFRYFLAGDKVNHRVKWGEHKKAMPGPWNGADTHGFKPELEQKIRTLEARRVRFYEDKVDDEIRVTARCLDLQPIRRSASTAEAAYHAVVATVNSVWIAKLPPLQSAR